MSEKTTYSEARANFASLCNRVAQDREIVYINRRNAEDVALVSASGEKSESTPSDSGKQNAL